MPFSHSRPLRVYLCDLTHDTLILVSDTIPINVGFIAAYAEKIHGEALECSLFKYPKSVLDAIKGNPPDVIALSNYSWNSNLSERVAGWAKKYNPNVLTVQGGTNFPHKGELQLDFLKTRPNTDVHIELEGEVAFAQLIGRVLDIGPGGNILDGSPISGCVYIHPESRSSAEPELIVGEKPERLKSLDEIPSPYLNGNLDSFFDGRLTPFLETNRGCPFTCTFCHTGNDYFKKINMFSMQRINEEIAYIAPKMSERGIVNLHIADTNFAMFPRDREICENLLKAQKDFGWPRQIMATTGKNNKARVIDITQLMGNTFSVNMSVQSMDPTVLKNIKRSNIKLEDYIAVNETLNKRGRATKGEVIIGLPGETKESFVRGVRNMLQAGVSSICSYSLMMLHGTAFKEPEYRAEFGMIGKHRIVPLNFGEYEGERVFDIEETCIGNKDMTFEDYLWIRRLSLLVEVLHNSRPFHEFFRYASRFGIKLFDFILRINDSLENAPPDVQKLLKGFIGETRGELWDSEEELVAFYRKDENYKKLFNGEVGSNIIYKYKAMSLAFAANDWIDHLSSVCLGVAKDAMGSSEELSRVHEEIAALAAFAKCRLAGVLNAEAETSALEFDSLYDIVGWKRASAEKPLSDFLVGKPLKYQFVFTEKQLEDRADQFKRYGTNANALSKIVTRVSNVESLFRTVCLDGHNVEAGAEEQDMFVRYAQSN